jgi:hypothetical protein
MSVAWVHGAGHDAIFQWRSLESVAGAQLSFWVTVLLRPHIVKVIAALSNVLRLSMAAL